MADDTINALTQQAGQSSLLGLLSSSSVVNPLAAISAGTQAASQVMDLREKQAHQATGQAFLNAIDPKTGQFSADRLNQNLAADPNTAMNAQQSSQQGVTNATNAYSLHMARLSASDNAMSALRAQYGNNPPQAAINAAIDQEVARGIFTQAEGATAKAQYGADPAANGQLILRNHIANLSAQAGLLATNPTLGTQNVGGAIIGTVQQPIAAPNAGALTAGAGGITTTASPDTVVSMPDLVVPATADDVKNGLAKTPGEMIHISGADRVKRYGYTRLLPPGAQEVPGTGGGGTGGGVVNSDGTPASATNPPRVRQLNVPGQGQGGGGSGALAPVATPSVAPAPPGGATGTPAPTGNVGIGAALNPPGTASAPAAAIPVPPVPPTSGVPLSGNGGLVRFPNGNVGTPGGGGLGSRSALEGGVPVASTNALAPTVGAGSPPSAAVPGNVNAILQGMANARTTPTPGTQVAGASFSTGPGYDEQVTAKTSQDRLASDTALAANYASNVFPQTQALSLLGRGMTTAPGSDFLNTAKGWAGGVYRSMGGTGVFDETKEYDSVHKWLSQIVAGNPVAQGSDARLAATLAGNANTGIHELASADMLKAGIALMRMNATASSEWKSNPAVRQQYGYYTDYLRDFNRTVDPRAFAWDMYNEAQKKDLAADLDKHDEAYAQRLHNSLQMVRRNGYMGEIRAMP